MCTSTRIAVLLVSTFLAIYSVQSDPILTREETANANYIQNRYVIQSNTLKQTQPVIEYLETYLAEQLVEHLKTNANVSDALIQEYKDQDKPIPSVVLHIKNIEKIKICSTPAPKNDDDEIEDPDDGNNEKTLIQGEEYVIIHTNPEPANMFNTTEPIHYPTEKPIRFSTPTINTVSILDNTTEASITSTGNDPKPNRAPVEIVGAAAVGLLALAGLGYTASRLVFNAIVASSGAGSGFQVSENPIPNNIEQTNGLQRDSYNDVDIEVLP